MGGRNRRRTSGPLLAPPGCTAGLHPGGLGDKRKGSPSNVRRPAPRSRPTGHPGGPWRRPGKGVERLGRVDTRTTRLCGPRRGLAGAAACLGQCVAASEFRRASHPRHRASNVRPLRRSAARSGARPLGAGYRNGTRLGGHHRRRRRRGRRPCSPRRRSLTGPVLGVARAAGRVPRCSFGPQLRCACIR